MRAFIPRLLVSLLTALLIVFSATIRSAYAQSRTPKAVFILIDGVPADVIEKLELPCIQEISRAGGFARAHVGGAKGGYSETPTISAPGYMDLITGTWGNKHNVWDNNIASPNYHYRNIFRVAKEVNPHLKIGIFSSWEDNRTKLMGEGLPAAGNILLDFKFDGLERDKIKYPHDKEALYIYNIDELVSSEAARVITEQGPDLSWVYLEYTDDMGHRYGDSPQLYDAVKNADRLIAKIWKAIQLRSRDFSEDWLIVITTDHGRSASTGKDHGGQSDRERTTWIVTNHHDLNSSFHENPGIVDIMPSVLRHLSLPVPEEVSKELDGIPFIGAIDFSDLNARVDGNTMVVTWKNRGEKSGGTLEIFDCETNLFKEGGTDAYQKVGEVAVSKEQFVFLSSGGSFHKILLKSPHQYSNTWVVKK